MKPLSIVICFSPAILADWEQAQSKQLCGRSVKMGDKGKGVKGIFKEGITHGIQVG